MVSDIETWILYLKENPEQIHFDDIRLFGIKDSFGPKYNFCEENFLLVSKSNNINLWSVTKFGQIYSALISPF